MARSIDHGVAWTRRLFYPLSDKGWEGYTHGSIEIDLPAVAGGGWWEQPLWRRRLYGVLRGGVGESAGSTFEGNDGNLVVNTAGNTDWANAPAGTPASTCRAAERQLVRAGHQGGHRERHRGRRVDPAEQERPDPLLRGVREARTAHNYLYLAWERLVNIGNANLDFEINQNATAGFTGTTTGPVTLNRTAGDMLVTYDFGG